MLVLLIQASAIGLSVASSLELLQLGLSRPDSHWQRSLYVFLVTGQTAFLE
jgi:hypothetical protein